MAIYKNTRFLVIGLGLCLLAGITYRVYCDDASEPLEKSISFSHLKDNPEAPLGNHALSPYFQAMDDKGQPYVIQAVSASLQNKDHLLVLDRPSYVVHLNAQKGDVTVTSEKGVLDQERKKLKLEGDVIVTYGQEITLKAPEVDVDLKEGNAVGHRSIQGESKNIQINAGAFDIQKKGDKIILTDNPTLILTLKGPS